MKDSNKLKTVKNEDTKKEAPAEARAPLYVLEVSTGNGDQVVRQAVADLGIGHKLAIRAVKDGVYTYPVPGGIGVVPAVSAKVTTTQQDES